MSCKIIFNNILKLFILVNFVHSKINCFSVTIIVNQVQTFFSLGFWINHFLSHINEWYEVAKKKTIEIFLKICVCSMYICMCTLKNVSSYKICGYIFART